MAASRCLRCKPRAFNPIHRLLRRSSHSLSPLVNPPSRMHSFTRPWLPRNTLNSRIEALLEARGFDLSFLNSKLDDLDFAHALNHLFDVSCDAALAFYFFRLSQRSHGIQHNLRTICTLIHISVSGNLNHIAVNLLRGIVAELGEGEGEWIHLVFDVLRDGSRERKDLGIVYSMLVRCCVDVGKVGAGLQLMERMKRYGFFPSVVEYCMGEHGDFGGAWKLVLEMWSGGVGVDVVVYTTVIHGLCKQGFVREGTCLLYKMLQMGVIIDSVLIASVINCYCKAGRMSEVKVFRSFPECVPDVFMYNSFMLRLCRDGNVVEANRLLNEMFELGVTPDSYNYDTLVVGYCKSEQVEEALKVFGQMIRRGHRPSVLTYTVLIEGHGKENQCELQTVETFFHAMKTDCLQPDVLAYNALIHVYCQMGYMSKAYELKDMMMRDGVSPDVATYNILMHGLIKRGFILESRELFNELVRRGFSPDKITYTDMIHGYSKQAKFEEAYLIWCTMTENGTKPDLVTCSALLSSMCKAKRMHEASVFFQKMLSIGLEPDLILYNTLIRGFCSEGNVDEAFNLLSAMAKHGVFPDNSTCRSLIYGLEKKGMENPIESAALKLCQIFHVI
ncbi:putative tetratricopeptide-like helical domain superfamily [Dioscorea sansibarensis]